MCGMNELEADSSIYPPFIPYFRATSNSSPLL
jgi:hypothetical protein